MPRWEVCRIQEIKVRQEGGFVPKRFSQWVTFSDTSDGERQVDKSAEYESPGVINAYPSPLDDRETFRTLRASVEERSKLIGRLLANGWEPLAFDQFGFAVAFRRQLSN